MFQCSCVAQSTSDRDVALRREQIIQAQRLWENTASEEALPPSAHPPGSTRAALITILHTIISHLTTNQLVFRALDFSKAVDTIGHSTLLNKYSQTGVPYHIYNWLVEYVRGHSHCTKYLVQTSALWETSTSIIHDRSRSAEAGCKLLRPVTLLYRYWIESSLFSQKDTSVHV